MKTKISLFLISFLLSILSYSQDQCGVDDISTRESPVSYCGDLSDYQPNANTQIKYIRMVFHIMQKSNGTGNFQEANQDHMNWLWSYESGCNSRLGNIPAPLQCGPTGDPYITDSKIRFKLIDIQFHQDDIGWTNNNSVDGDYCYTNYGVDKDKVLNVFFISSTGSISGSGMGYNGEGSNYVMLISDYNDYITFGPRPWIRHPNLMHEVGHCLNLHHAWLTSQFIMFPDIYDQNKENFCNPYLSSPPCQTCTNNLMSYSKDQEYLSPMQLGFIHKELTYSWRYKMLDADEFDANKSIEITTDETWDFGKVIGGNITVKAGATLTIQCDVFMCKDGQIIVEPGARLLVDGGRITNKRKEFWNGIIVLGNRNHDQNPVNPTYQGLVHLSNGATIEYAHCAIAAGKYDDYNAAGGVILAYDSYFTNNRRSIEYYSYDNKVGSTIFPNRGYFANCVFEVNDDLDDQNGLYPFKNHVTAWQVEGVQFVACKFLNTRTDKVWDSNDEKNHAIFTLSSNLKISGSASDPNGYGEITATSPDFEGFNRAIEFTGYNDIYTSFVHKCAFENNVFGVEVNGMPNVSVTRNLFNLGSTDVSGITSDVKATGTEVQKCTGFEVEENYFDKTGQVMDAIGVSTLNINQPPQIIENNEVYKNRMDNLKYGVQATGQNREADQFTGVQFLCNQFETGSYRDIDVTKDQFTPATNDAIRIFQGSYDGTVSSRVAAGNLFSATTDPDFLQINNKCNSTFNYQYNNSINTLEYPTLISNKVIALGAYTTPNPITVAFNSCPSHISNGIDYPYDAQKETALLADFNTAKTAYWNLYYNYLQLIDNGNTPNVLQEIQNTWPQEAWDLRNDLLQISPYLSQDALLEAANSGILPDALLLEICLANPDATRSEEFLDELRNNIPNPLPEYMIDMIRNSWNTETSRTIIELGLAEYGAAKDYAFNRLMTNEKYVSETSGKDYTAIRTLLGSRDELGDRYSIVDTYVAENDFTSANDELSDIEQDYTFTDQQLDEHENYVDFVGLLEALFVNSRTIYEFTSTEISQLDSIANAETGLSSVKARNILCFAYGLCDYNYANPSTSGTPKSVSTNTNNPDELFNELYNTVHVSPNPASSYTEFSWELLLLKKKAMLEIYDISGKLIYQYQINNQKGAHVWKTSGLKPGNYIYRVIENENVLNTGNVTIN